MAVGVAERVPRSGWAVVCSAVHLSWDPWVASSLTVLGEVVRITVPRFSCGHKYPFLRDKCPGVNARLYGQRGLLCETSRLFPKSSLRFAFPPAGDDGWVSPHPRRHLVLLLLFTAAVLLGVVSHVGCLRGPDGR